MSLPMQKTLSEYPAILARNHAFFGGQGRNVNALILRGEMDIVLLKAALETLYWHHPLLRATLDYNEREKRYYFSFHENFSVVPIETIISKVKNSWKSILEKKIAEQFPASLYLWEVTIISEAENKHIILLHFHHAISDGASILNLLHELMIVYHARLHHGVINLPKDELLAPIETLFLNPCDAKSVAIANQSYRKQHPLPEGDHFETWVPIEQRAMHTSLFAFDLSALKSKIAEKRKQDDVRYSINNVLIATLLLAKKKMDARSCKAISLLTCVGCDSPLRSLSPILSWIACLM